jgi:GNAT superfamily N-acetyltransferase
MTTRLATPDDAATVAQMLHDFNEEFGTPTPGVAFLTDRCRELIDAGEATVVLGGDPPVGVGVLFFRPSLWSLGQEAYLAELYVVPSRRGQGYGRELITEAIRVARDRGANYALVVTSEEDRLAQRLYEAAGFRRTEGDGGPVMWAYERDL